MNTPALPAHKHDGAGADRSDPVSVTPWVGAVHATVIGAGFMLMWAIFLSVMGAVR